MFAKKINKLHMLTEIWRAPANVVKLWFLLLMFRDERARIETNTKNLFELSGLSREDFDDAYYYLLGQHDDNLTPYIETIESGFRIVRLDRKERNSIDLMPAWKEKTPEGFRAYIEMTENAFNSIMADYDFLLYLKENFPNHNIRKSIQNAFSFYWGTERAWLRQRSKRSRSINWRETIQNTIKYNLVEYKHGERDFELEYLIGKVKEANRSESNAATI